MSLKMHDYVTTANMYLCKDINLNTSISLLAYEYFSINIIFTLHHICICVCVYIYIYIYVYIYIYIYIYIYMCVCVCLYIHL